MEGVVEGEHQGAPREAPRQVQRRLVGLGAAVDEVDGGESAPLDDRRRRLLLPGQ